MTNFTPSLVLLFPGQGSQSVGMGKEAAQAFPEFRRTLQEASDVLGYSMERLCFEDPEQQLNLTAFTQPALLATSVATLRVLEKRTDLFSHSFCVAGHSLGEYSALVASNGLEFADALKAVRFRGEAMQRAVPVGVGAMAAYIGSQINNVTQMCANETKADAVVEVVNFNSKQQLVLSGHAHAVEKACKLISQEKWGRAIPLSVSAPFHSSLMKPAAQEMQEYLGKTHLSSLKIPLIANVDAQWKSETQYTKTTLVQQIASAVLWTQSIEIIKKKGENVHHESGTLRWVEVGAGTVLQGLLKKTLDGEKALGTQDLSTLETTLAELEISMKTGQNHA
jgi:[acyl-carrier-protein] S-malonyltransferase